jgi:hypothetical protein
MNPDGRAHKAPLEQGDRPRDLLKGQLAEKRPEDLPG